MLDPLASAAITRAQAALSIASGGGIDRLAARDYARSRMALALAKHGLASATQIAAARWGADSEVLMIVRAGVAATDAEDMSRLGGAGSASEAFFARVREASVVGRLIRARRIAFNVRTLTPDVAGTGHWVGEKKAIPISRVALAGDVLDARKVAGIVIASNESIADPASEDRVVEDLVTACAHVLDSAFLDDTAGDHDRPAGILEGVTPIVSLGDPISDLSRLVEIFQGDLSTACVITDPATAVALALVGGSPFQGLGANGGAALGMPWYTSRMSPHGSDGGQIVLLDEASLALAADAFELSVSTAAALELDDEPQGDGAGPAASSANVVSLFQAELSAFRATVRANWRFVRPDAVAAVAGCDYQTGS